MLAGIVHIHFREGERGPEEATLHFEEAMLLLEKHGMKQVVATFHLRHPSDLRPAAPQALITAIDEYDGPIGVGLMPEANLLLRGDFRKSGSQVSHDINTWEALAIQKDQFCSLLNGWIVSAHYTAQLGWRKNKNEQRAYEQTYQFMWPVYYEIMHQNWRGWIGHPFQWCTGHKADGLIERLVETAVNTRRIVEISIKPICRLSNPRIDQAQRWIPLLRPDIITQFASYSMQTNMPLIAISLDAHHMDDLKYGLDNACRVAEWLVTQGVLPKQIWGWSAD